MKKEQRSWREVFRQDEAAVLKYLKGVADAWKERDRRGIVPFEHRAKGVRREV